MTTWHRSSRHSRSALDRAGERWRARSVARWPPASARSQRRPHIRSWPGELVAPAPDLLAHYGTAVVFAWAFAVQAGLPAPAVPMLLGAGALSYGIPGACWIPPERLREPHQLIPKGSEIAFYCAEPREATSARMALLLSSHGYKNLHPLSGGLEGW